MGYLAFRYDLCFPPTGLVGYPVAVTAVSPLPDPTPLTLAVIDAQGIARGVSAVLLRPRDARWLYLFAHGAGAGMNHPFMCAVAARLATRGVASLRYQFPYMDAGRRRPDPARLLLATVGAAITWATSMGMPVIAGGKSMGGRMSSQYLSSHPDSPPPPVPPDGPMGLALIGFPLHPAGKPSNDRGLHLTAIDVPMLFVQGTRDTLAELPRMQALCHSLGRRATLHVVDGGDHSFKVLKRSGRNPDRVLDEIADAITTWGDQVTTQARSASRR